MTINLAERMGRIDSSGIRKVFNLAADIKDPINLSIGQPHFDVPDFVKEAAVEAIRAGQNRYTLTQGIPALRRAVQKKLKDQNGITVDEDQLFISSGVSGALTLLFMALFNPGDEIIVSDPYFVEYKHLGNLLGAKVVYADTYPDLRMTAERIAPCITPKTKALILNNPANPTGVMLTEAELRAIAVLARENDLLVISDEIYELFTYGGARFFSIGSVYDKTVTVNGFSKTHSMTGWRVGYVAGPREIITAITTLQQYTYVCAPSPFQAAAVRALSDTEAEHIKSYNAKRDLAVKLLKDHFELVVPEGAIYLFPKVPKGTATEFVKRAIAEKQVLIIPGNVFSERDTHFRMSFATEDETLVRGCKALCDLAETAE